MQKMKLSTTEKIILVLVLLMIVAGYVLFYTNVTSFETYVQEDGFVEWLTVLGLLMGFVVCIGRFIRLLRKRKFIFLFVTLLLALLLFVAAGEEISWGQRILGIKSSDFFQKNNSQGETNFHNLVLNGVKINKIVFSFGLIAVMAIYIVIFPLLYRTRRGFTNFIDKSGIMMPQVYQVLSIGLLFLLTELIHHGKRAELLEAGIALLFYLIIRFPVNKATFEDRNHMGGNYRL